MMGRRRKIKVDDLYEHTMNCEKCGIPLLAYDKNVQSVLCGNCHMGTVPCQNFPDAMKQLDELADKQEEMQSNQPKRGKRGRRSKRKQKKVERANSALNSLVKKLNRKVISENQEDDANENVKSVSQSTNENVVNVEKKPKKKKCSKRERRNEMAKRGRKSTVSARIVEHLQENSPASFDDLLKVYSEERTRMGKNSGDPKIEMRNCRSTLYVLVRNGKLVEVEKKKVYALNALRYSEELRNE